MKKTTKLQDGASKSNVSASARAATRSQQQSSQQRLDAPAASPSMTGFTPSNPMQARYIDSRLKQFCLR